MQKINDSISTVSTQKNYAVKLKVDTRQINYIFLKLVTESAFTEYVSPLNTHGLVLFLSFSIL